ncbi:uncharacterized protein LOC120111032 isoform X5 [Phoenix dactylifera]|uniref:Uncharacterized protein LOC120111032 isoform X5 n=1 Tax=Phoenix dactylifera TaxID=42345 RepID=A0A8B9A9F4_PHODC|nr:uncharacterized protein LOC120111032 isoform X5 [Phoenix dactylifera]
METELIPVVDLRLLSQAELNTLSLSCPNAFDPHRCDDIVVPKIDRSVFNESAGSRKQTYSRLRLAPRKPNGPPSSFSSSSSIARRRPRGHLSSSPHSFSATSATDGTSAEDDDPGRRKNQQIVSFLRQLFAREDSSAPPPQLPSQSQTNLALTVATPISTHRNPDAGDSSSKALVVVDDRDREVLNAKGVAVDLVGLGEMVDPFGEKLRRRTAGLKAEEELLRFLSGLEGQWGNWRKRRKIVDASVVGDDLPRGWKLLLELKRKDGVAGLNCRQYVSERFKDHDQVHLDCLMSFDCPNGKQFVSCKEVSSYILSLISHPNEMRSVSVRNDGSTHELDKSTPRSQATGLAHQEDIVRENHSFSSVTPIASYLDDNQKQVVLYKVEKQTSDDLKNILECHACHLTFADKDTDMQHQLLFHQRSVKRRRLGKSIGDGVIVKDGKYECQFCHKTFSEIHRYNGHIGAHVRYQGLSAEGLPDIMTRKIFNPSPLVAVLYGFSETNLAKENEETCNAKSADELHVDSSECRIETKNPEIDHNAKSGGSKTTEVACTSISVDDQNNDHNLTNYKSDEIVRERNITDDKSAACMDAISPFVVDVNNVAQNCSRFTTREASTSNYVDDQPNNIDMIDYKCKVVEASSVEDLKCNDSQGNDSDGGGYILEDIIESSNTKDVKPDTCLDAVFSPPKNGDIATCETMTEIGPSSTSISVDNVNDYHMTGHKSEEVVDINNAVGVKPTNNEIDLSSCTMIPDIGKYGTDEKVNSERHLLTISGCHSFSDKEPVTGNIMPDEFNASCTDTTFVNGHTGVIETDAHRMFDIDMNESVLEEMDKPGNVLETCFVTSNAGCEEVVLSNVVANNDRTNSLQGNVAGTSSWVHSADGVPIVDMIPEQTSKMALIQRRGKAPSVGLKNMVNGRCYFSHFVHFTVTLVKSMSREQKERVTGTPFGHMLALPYIKQSRPVLDTLLSFWDDKKEGFWFGKVLVPFVGSDFALILGLSATGNEVQLHKEGRVKSDLITRFFEGDHKKADRDAVKNKLQYLVGKSEKQDVEDFTKLWVLYLFVTILFPSIHYYILKALCSYLDDLDCLGSYSWGLAVFAFLRQQIPSLAESVRTRNITGKGSTRYMNGCTVALVAWAVEHANSLLGSHRPPFMYPRLLRWSNAPFPRKVDAIAKVMKNLKRFQVIGKLEPREEELHLLSRGRPQVRAPIEMRGDEILQKGVHDITQGDEVVLQRALNIVYRKREDYIAMLFYAPWCPFSRICRPNFQVLSSLFPTIRHFAFEESVIRSSILSRYGVHGFPTLFLLNSTMRVRYRGSRNITSLVAFYNDVTGANPAVLDPIPVEKIVDPSTDTELKEDNEQENCPFSWGRSPEKLLQQDTYLVLAWSFVLMRLLYILLPKLNACVKRAWRRHMQYASLMSLQDRSQAYVDHVKQGFNRLNPCKRGNLQEGAMNAKVWASKSLASVSIGEPSSGRAYSAGDRR